MSERPLRVAVMSPHPIVTQGLRAMLDTMRGHVQFVHPDDIEGPDVVLYDAIGLTGGDTTGLDRLVEKGTARVLVMSRDLNPDRDDLTLTRGAHGCFSMSASRREILTALKVVGVHRRPRPVSDRAVVAPDAHVRHLAAAGATWGLTQREAQILQQIGRGWTNIHIAELLYLSPNTVKTYIRNAYRKIGVTSRSQATAWAFSHGLTTAPDTVALSLAPSAVAPPQR